MINPEFIHAYLDGELDPQQARQLGLWLLADPANQDRFDEEIDLVVGIIALTRRPKLNSSSSQRTNNIEQQVQGPHTKLAQLLENLRFNRCVDDYLRECCFDTNG